MNTNNISFTIPMTRSALIRTSEMLTRMVDDLEQPDTPDDIQLPGKVHDVTVVGQVSTTAVDDQHAPDPTAVFGGGKQDDPKSTPTPDADTATVPDGSTTTPSLDSVSASNQNAPVGVELDAEGLPWDSRIHASSKAKLSRGNTWKLKRGVDPSLVETVKAELRQLMSVETPQVETAVTEPVATTDVPPPPPATTTETPVATTDVPPPPAETQQQQQVPPPPVTETQPNVITFPVLMQAITGNGIAQDQVTAACNKHGVPSAPLLAARPDLVPLVYAELFPSTAG